MTSDEHPSWSTAESFVPLSSMPEDDFTNFLDLDHIDFSNFPILDGANYENGPDGHNEGSNGNDAAMAQSFGHFSHTSEANSGHPSAFEQVSDAMRDSSMMVSDPLQNGNDSGYTREGRYQWSNDQFQPHVSVPPTPNSAEMYANPYKPHLDHARFSNGNAIYAPRDDSFTPDTSPNYVHNGVASVRDYATKDGHSLSPLTSPAMYPQPIVGAPSSVHSMTAESSVNASPIDLDHDTGGEMSMDERPRKSRRKDTVLKSKMALPPRKRKTSIGSKVEMRRSHEAVDLAATPASLMSYDSSMTSSASPQVLPQSAMRPPPKPLSARSTPTIHPRSGSIPPNGPPATPSSLMRLSKQTSNDGRTSQSSMSPTTDALGLGMEELTLPEAAASPIIQANTPSRGHSSVRSTPAILPRIPSVAPSPIIASPSVPFGNTSKNPSGRGGNRKRNSTSSTLVSPALRPRISPSIKPMMSNGTPIASQVASDETHALLLASKSNYQNLLEGNHLPGVNYPSELSTNLTSKRTSHKIAEQGRRNRINTALQEMQSLLPASPVTKPMSPGSGGEGSGSGSGKPTTNGAKAAAVSASNQAANSKAATVEQAIEYIKTLNGKLLDKDAEVSRLKSEMDELKKKLGDESAMANDIAAG